ncbi:MAG TPA: hypothetical protein P5056_02015 [Candidatus Paceibacterota bacterium]|nr:hypothetical protein [Candidatus Paceibacterota bacterium]
MTFYTIYATLKKELKSSQFLKFQSGAKRLIVANGGSNMNKTLCFFFIINCLLAAGLIWVQSVLSTTTYYPGDGIMGLAGLFLGYFIARAEFKYMNTH